MAKKLKNKLTSTEKCIIDKYGEDLHKWDWEKISKEEELTVEFMDKYEIHQVGASHHTEWWIPAQDLEELNKNIVGKIEVIREFKK